MLSLSSDYGSNPDDEMIDVLGKLVTEGFCDFGVTFPDESVGGREPRQVRHGLQVPDNDTEPTGMGRWDPKRGQHTGGRERVLVCEG
jgi:hypothetical protein